ncbi:GtrA family protein [Candidatus Gracilibacteria bacterium]|nr:GtrA family protein [Candidatus Gracilibacteria bacterium]
MQLLKFVIIGGFSAVLDLILLYVFTDILGFYYLVSACMSFNIVLLIAFFVHKKYTFVCTRKDVWKQYLSFFLVNVSSFGVYSLLLFIGVDILKYHYIAIAMAAKILVMGLNFFASKYITFASNAS